MNDKLRTIGGNRSSNRKPLPVDAPWPEAGPKTKSALRVGNRCALELFSANGPAGEAFTKKYGAVQDFPNDHPTVKVVAATVEVDDFYTFVVLDIWAERKHASQASYEEAADAIASARAQLAGELEPSGIHAFEVIQEFLEVKLAAFRADGLDSAQLNGAIVAARKSRKSYEAAVETVTVAAGILTLGPEAEGTSDDVVRYLSRTSHDARDPAATPLPHGPRRWIPFALVAVLLDSWAFPLTLPSVVALGFALVALFAMAIWPLRADGWRNVLSHLDAIASIGLFGIGAFGIAYAVCALVVEGSLGANVHSLGIPFLIASGVGIAGGVIGDNPKGPAQIIAHAQLLLALGGIAVAFALLLRIEIQTAQRRG